MALIGGGIARSIMKASIPSLLRQGMSAGASIRFFRGMNVGIRRTDFLKLFRIEAGRSKKQGLLSAVRRDYRPSDALGTEAKTAMPRNRLYKIHLDVFDEEGNVVGEKYTSVMTDGRLTRGEAELAAMEDISPESSPLDIGSYGNPVIDDLILSPGI